MQPRDLSDHVPYEAGRGIEEVARELDLDPGDLVKLSSNENPHGPSPRAVETIQDVAPTVNHYPKSSHTDLTAALAERWDVDPVQVWVANGGDGALDYLARAMLEPDDPVLVPDPGFAYYAMSARYHHGTVREYGLSKAEDFAQTPGTVLSAYDGERVVYLTSPHNPAGTEVSLDDVRAIADGTDDETLTLVDEAYGEYSTTPSAVSLLDERDDVAVLRTFSKAYGLAGLRLGYAVVPESWGDAYARVNTPFAASELTCRAGLAALRDQDHVETSVETAQWAREYMADHVDATVWAGQGNFVLVDVGHVDADHPAAAATGETGATAVDLALRERGVIVRDCSSYGLPDCVRVSCGTEAETRTAVAELNEVLAR